ncbi:winged helix-turn-helix transcriptional regulator [Streptomyces sp. H39-S7]|uniref:winged helix-turn-helix transcriptional regulator n=1 Tax=Streptomyces sp. H39-S7 TaxID=3004357 RepID=UPI0022AED896|nr:winged helix-turn-helix transcriptional regulator [Streptomyces sp. H39-S7]MCZ4124191.1 winged helix-turn-helix transcriptional regulator [Streptomyces sp. H39-S7]
MALTGLPTDTDADIARVAEALAMITPRWNVRILLAISGRALRYSEISGKVSWLNDSQLHPKLRALCDAGLLQRTEHTTRHVTYGHTERGAALLSVLPMIVTWAEEHLETAEHPLPAIEQIEDSLTLLTRKHAAAILWVLKSNDGVSGQALAKIIMPSSHWTNIYPPLRQLVSDGLVTVGGTGQPYRLSVAGEGLGPVFGALSAWAGGQPLTQAARHPLWGRRQAEPTALQWVSNPSRVPTAPTSRPPTRGSETSHPTWQNRDLFSHPAAARPNAALPAGVPRR